jgi:uncharacterized protein YwqG
VDEQTLKEMRQKSEKLVHNLAIEAGLTQFADGIVALIKPAIGIEIHRVEDNAEIPIGKSKFGGLPDVSSRFSWPMWRNLPLSFLAQFNLSETAPCDVENILPKTGLLYFFTLEGREDAWEHLYDLFDPTGWRIIYSEDESSSRLQRAQAPENLTPEGQFYPCSIEYYHRLSLPYGGIHGTRQMRELGLTEEDDEVYTHQVYFKLSELPDAEARIFDSFHQLLGWPKTIQTDLQQGSEIYSQGLAWQTEIEPSKLDSWRLLLQTGLDAEFFNKYDDWAMYFMIRQEDLAARFFEKVWLEAQGD